MNLISKQKKIVLIPNLENFSIKIRNAIISMRMKAMRMMFWLCDWIIVRKLIWSYIIERIFWFYHQTRDIFGEIRDFISDVIEPSVTSPSTNHHNDIWWNTCTVSNHSKTCADGMGANSFNFVKYFLWINRENMFL